MPPFQGLLFKGDVLTCGDAPGYYIAPFQGFSISFFRFFLPCYFGRYAALCIIR